MYEYELEIALEAVKEGARRLTGLWGNLMSVRDKTSPGNLVTEADMASETVILNYLKKRFPDYGYISEESHIQDRLQNEFVWVLDPLDGTVNYAHLYPMTAISLALLREGRPVIGIVHNPFLDGLYHAVKDKGAFFNRTGIRVSQEKDLHKCLLGTGFSYDRRESEENNYLEFCHLTNITQGVRRAGSAALDLAYTSMGRLDGYWERGLHIWDMAAGVLIVEEAGGRTSNYDGGPVDLHSGKVVATNGHIHDQLIEQLQKCAVLEAEKQELFSLLGRLSL